MRGVSRFPVPNAAPKPCIQCSTLVHDGTTRCAAHKVRSGSFADRSRGTRHQRGYGADWDVRRLRILARDAGVCQPCARHDIVHAGTQVDHKVPREQGGSEDDSNLQVICRVVHQAKTDAEKHGRAWDEDAWFEAQAGTARAAGAAPHSRQSPEAAAAPGMGIRGSVARGQAGGGSISGGQAAGTVLPGEFSASGVSRGGYPSAGGQP